MKDYLTNNRQAYSKLANQYRKRIDEYKISDVQLLKPFIDALKARHKNSKVLELGPGSGLALSFFEKAGFETTAIEFSEEIIKVAEETSPHSKFIHDNFLSHDFGFIKYEGVFAKAFIHLFPKADATKVLDKIYRLTTDEGIFFLSTTVHEIAKEGYEEKADYSNSPRRFRKKWTESELLETLDQKWQVLDKNYNQDRGKNWIALTLIKI